MTFNIYTQLYLYICTYIWKTYLDDDSVTSTCLLPKNTKTENPTRPSSFFVIIKYTQISLLIPTIPHFNMLLTNIKNASNLSNVFKSLKYKRNFATDTENLVKTALYDMHLELGGDMVPFAGYTLPVLYKGENGGVMKEHLWCREEGKASLFDVSHMGQVGLYFVSFCAFGYCLIYEILYKSKDNSDDETFQSYTCYFYYDYYHDTLIPYWNRSFFRLNGMVKIELHSLKSWSLVTFKDWLPTRAYFPL